MSIRAQITINNLEPFATKVAVEILDADDRTFRTYWVQEGDAEYLLLAQAVDRFAAVAEERRKLAAAEKEAALLEKARAAQ